MVSPDIVLIAVLHVLAAAEIAIIWTYGRRQGPWLVRSSDLPPAQICNDAGDVHDVGDKSLPFSHPLSKLAIIMIIKELLAQCHLLGGC